MTVRRQAIVARGNVLAKPELLSRPCPKCGAAIGFRCTRKNYAGYRVPIKTTHAERWRHRKVDP